MSVLVFDGHHHVLSIIDRDGKLRGSWTAYNNIDSKFAAAHYHGTRHLANGIYPIQDPVAPHFHQATEDGPYGLHGIIRFSYPGHPGVGVHAGRAHDKHVAGPQHATHGCIRTTDDAMAAIKEIMKKDSLTTITVSGNSEISLQHSQHRRIHHPIPSSHAGSASGGGIRG